MPWDSVRTSSGTLYLGDIYVCIQRSPNVFQDMASFSDQGHLKDESFAPVSRLKIFQSFIRVQSNLSRMVLLFFFSRSVVSDSLQPHELQHARLLGPSLSPRAGSNSCPLSH